MDFAVTKNPYEHFEQTTHMFVKLVNRKREMEETFHPNMLKDYNNVKNEMISTAFELLKLGVQNKLDQDNVYLTVDDTEYAISRADMMKVINKDQWDELFPMDNVQVIKAEIETNTENKEEDEAVQEDASPVNIDPQAMQNPLAALFTAFGAALSGGNANDMANNMAVALKQAFQPPQVTLVDEVGGIQRKIALLEKERDEAIKKCTGYKQALESATADVEELKAQHDEELENSTAELKKEVENLKSEADKSKSRAENAFKERDNLQKEVGRLNRAVEDSNRELNKVKDSMQRQTSDNRNAVQKAKDEVTASLNKVIDEKTKKISELEASLKDASNNEDLVKEYEAKISAKEKALEELQKKFDALSAEVDAGKKHLSELQQKLSNLEQENKSLEELAYHDKKVGIYNANAFNRDFQKVNKNEKTLIITGIRNMKAINDQYGRQAGDKLIQVAAECYTKEFGKSIYRVFGDEFAIITDYDFNTVMSKLQNVKETLEAQQIFVVYGICDGKTVSSIKEMVVNAEHAMVAMKNNPGMADPVADNTQPVQNSKPVEAEPEEIDMSDLMEEYLATEN